MVPIILEDKYYVYRHVRLDTNVPFYIGVGTKPKKYNGQYTEYSRANSKQNRNVFWKRILNKSSYRVDILLEVDSIEKAYEKEIEFIKLYGRRDLNTGSLVNLTSGGVGISDVSKGVRDKISRGQINSNQNNLQLSKDRSERIKLKWQDPLFRDKIVAGQIERNKNKEYKANLSNKAKERWKSDSYKLQKSEEAKEMWKNPEYKAEMGKKSSERWLDEEYRNKVITTSKTNRQLPENKQKRKTLMRELKGKIVVDKETGIFYNSLPEACEVVNIDYKKENWRLHRKSKLSRFIRATDN